MSVEKTGTVCSIGLLNKIVTRRQWMRKFLETDRLIIKLTSIDDFDNILALRSDPRVQKYTTKPPATKEDVQRFLDMIIPYQVFIILVLKNAIMAYLKDMKSTGNQIHYDPIRCSEILELEGSYCKSGTN